MTTGNDDAGLRLRRLDLAAVERGEPHAVLDHRALTRRGAVPHEAVRTSARATLAEVRRDGSPALHAANQRFGGGAAGGAVLLPRAHLARARDALARDIRSALDQAIANVTRFACDQLPVSSTTVIGPGVEIERRWRALASVGAYVPGGSAPYPSSLIMTVVPARVAGVERIVVATPAGRDGSLHPILLGAAGLLGLDEVLVAGGAQAIGALAYGLPDIGFAPVDRIVGPGNPWVTAAKIEVCGDVGIDLPAGPSEGLVLAAPPASPRRVALDLMTQAEHGPDSPAILVTTVPAFADQVEAAIHELLATSLRRDILARSLAEHGRVVIAADLDAAIRFANDYAPEHLSVDVEPLEATVERLHNAGSIFVGAWAPESAGDYATGANHVLPTGGLARSSSALSVADYGRYTQVQRMTREGLAGLAGSVATLAEAEGLHAHRDAVTRRSDDRPSEGMRPTPVSFSSPDQPASYSWEATDEEVAARYGLPVDRVVRFDLNTSPSPPDLMTRLLAAGRFETPLSEYAPSDYRRLIAAASARYGVDPDEVLVGAGADEILDIVGKAYLPAGARAIVPAPTYAMYRVITEQRGAEAVIVPRRGADQGYALDLAATRAAAQSAAVVWLCSPNNPTALAEPAGTIETLLTGIEQDAQAAGRPTPLVVLDEAYAEFVGTSLLGLRHRFPDLLVVRTASKAYALAGLRVGFGLARPAIIARLDPFRPPGSVSTVSVSLVTAALLDDDVFAANVERVQAERERLAAALGYVGWNVGPSVTNFLLVGFGTTQRTAAVARCLLGRGLVPRTFATGHPLAAFLRLTVRSISENDRLIAAATAIETEATP